MKIVVTGAGGFIGHHLVKRLKKDLHFVRGYDLKKPEFEPSPADVFRIADLRDPYEAMEALDGCDQVYHLASDMGGIGYIATNRAEIVRNNTLIDLNVLEAARSNGVVRLLYSSSACVYNIDIQDCVYAAPLREEQAYPAKPEAGYGEEKLYMEQMCRYWKEDWNVNTCCVRFHNIFGELGTYDGGREKSPAAICRKVALAPDGGEIEIWGDGKQTRTYCYIDDAVEGLIRVMNSNHGDPINIGTDELVTIDELVDLVCRIAGKTLKKVYNATAPQGVRGRNCDISFFKKTFGWVPATPLKVGLEKTYRWIESELRKTGRVR